MVLAFTAIKILPGQIPSALLDNMPYLQALRVNLHSLLFAAMLSILGGILFAAGPALRLLLSDMQEGLLEGGRTAVGRGWRRLGAGLVVVELAITVVLLVSAGLLAKSFYLLLHTDLGISPDHLAVLHVVKPGPWSTEAPYIALERQIISRLSNLPGVTSVGVSRYLAVGSGDGFSHFKVIGRPYAGQGNEANDRIASVGYFETLQARLLLGRYFTERDDTSRPRVGIINQTMAKQEFAGIDPLGKHIVSEYDQEHPIEIIGVIDDIKEGPLDKQPTAAVYEPFNQDVTNDFYVTLRTSQPAESILHSMVRVVHDIGTDLIADDEGTMSARISDSQSAYLHRCTAWLVAGFAALALLLGTVGLYGVISYSVGQRTREIGVRMALGAQRASVYRLILREACGLAALGIVGGIGCSFAATRLLRSMLFGVSTRDAGTAISVVCVLIASALLASFVPARRAASIDPAKALRTE
jgi:macrolide transport system ATP-binding/permease protein